MPKQYLKDETEFGAFRKMDNNYPRVVRWGGNIMQEIGGWMFEVGVKYGDLYEYCGRSNNEPED